MKYAVILLLLLLSCNKDEPILPKEEEEAVKFPEEIIGWEGTMAFYYRGEKYESRFYHNKSNLNRIT